MARSAEVVAGVRLMTSDVSVPARDRALGDAPIDVVRPTDTPAVREVVRDAAARRTPLRLVGRGTWLDAGRPVRAGRVLALDGLTGILDYTPGDLTLTARAGTPLADIAAATAIHGQWLALAPWGGDAGSLGATLATATAGPMSGALGTPRDIALGLEAVTGAGDIVRGGGRVVKNVAGFDLTRLMVGAWGTLGALTEVSVRLRALPERDETVALALPTGAPALTAMLASLRSAPIAPLAVEMLTPSLADRLGLGRDGVVLVRLAGNDPAVAAQRDVLGGLGDMRSAPGAVWDTLRTVDRPGAWVLRLSGPAQRLGDAWGAAERLIGAAGGGWAHASVARAVVRVHVPDVAEAAREPLVQALRALPSDGRVIERLPDALWSTLAPCGVTDRLSRGIRTAFDPHHVLNPGILGEAVA